MKFFTIQPRLCSVIRLIRRQISYWLQLSHSLRQEKLINSNIGQCLKMVLLDQQVKCSMCILDGACPYHRHLCDTICTIILHHFRQVMLFSQAFLITYTASTNAMPTPLAHFATMQIPNVISTTYQLMFLQQISIVELLEARCK